MHCTKTEPKLAREVNSKENNVSIRINANELVGRFWKCIGFVHLEISFVCFVWQIYKREQNF